MNNKYSILSVLLVGLLIFFSSGISGYEQVSDGTGQDLSFECVTDNDCDDYNSCTLDSCSSVPGSCLHAPLKGCHTRYGCVGEGTIGIQTDWPVYCSRDGDWIHMRTEGSFCSVDYECRSEDCQAGKCRGEPQEFSRPSLWRRFWWSFQ